MREEERYGERRKERRNMERDGEISIYISMDREGKIDG